MTTSLPTHHPFFLQGGGEAGALIRHTNWASTPLGSSDRWPPPLRHAVRFMLDSSLPMYIAWGPAFTMIYNDGYIPSLGPARHPKMMGRSLADVSPEVWHNVLPLYKKVMGGEKIGRENHAVVVNKAGTPEECFFNLSYIPIYLDNGTVGGIQAVFIETTDTVRAIQKLEEANDQLRFAVEATELATWDFNPLTNTFTANARYTEWFGISAEAQTNNDQSLEVIAEEDRHRVLDALANALHPELQQPFDIEYTIRPAGKPERVMRAKGRARFNNDKVAYRLNGTLQDITEQVTGRQRLQEKEERLRFALAAGHLGFWELDLRTMDLNASDHCKFNFGQPLDKPFTYEGLYASIHPEDRRRQEKAVRETITTGKDYDIEYRVVWPDASVHWVNVRGQLRRNADGTPLSMIGVSVDITEKKTAEDALRNTTTHLQMATAASQVGTWTLDVAAETLAWSDLHKSLWGYNPARTDLVYADWHNVILPEDKEAAFAEVQKAKDKKKPYENVYRIRRANDGVVRWMLSTGQYFYNPQGEAVLLTGTSRDITESKDAEEAVRYRTALLEAQNEAIPDALLIVDTKGKMISYNRHFAALWRIPKAIVDAKDDAAALEFAMTQVADPGAFIARVAECYANPDIPAHEEVLFADGRIVERWGNAVVGKDGTRYGWIWCFRDVTERKRSVEVLRASEDRYQNFVRQSTEGIWRFEVAEPIPTTLPAAEQIDRFFANGYLAECNDAMAQMYGYGASDELAGMRLSDFFPRDGDTETYFTHFIRSGYRVENAESKELTKDGSVRYFSNNLVGIVEDGLLRRAWGTQRDITAQREAEEKIRESEEKQAYLLRLSDAIKQLTEPHQIQYKAACVLGKHLGVARAGYAEDAGDWVHVKVTRNYTQAVKGIEGTYRYVDYGAELLKALSEGRTVVRPDVATDVTLTDGEKAAHRTLNLGATVNVPLLKEGKLVGILFVHCTEARTFQPEEIFLIEQTAERTWAAVERARAETSLRLSEERYRTLFNSIDEGFCTIDVLFDESGKPCDYRFLETNKAFVQQTGLENAVGRTMNDFARIEDFWYQTYANVAISGKAVRFENRAENLHRFYDVYAFKVGAPDERKVAVLFTDITERKTAEMVLKESENRFRSLANDTPAFMFTADANTHVDFVNNRWLEFVGLDSAEGAGKAWATITHPDDVEPMYAVYTEAVNTLAPYQFEIRQRRADGQFRWVLWNGIPRKTPDGGFGGMMGIGIDVTEQKEAESLIKQSEERFRQLADLVPQIVWTATPDGFVDYYNQRWYQFSGFEEGYGDTSWLPVLHPDEAQAVADTWYNSVRTGQPYQVELRFKNRATGGYRWFLAKAVPVRDKDGVITKWFGTTTDIHDQKRMTERLENLVKERTQELQRSNEDLQQFAHVASHDLKEPVRKIRTFGSRLQNEFAADLPEKARLYLNKMESAADRMYSMIEGVLQYSTLNASHQKPEPVNLAEVVASVEADLDVMAQEKGATIQRGALPTVQGAAVLLHQLFYNLVYNALKFSRKEVKPVITVAATEAEKEGRSWAVVAVQDNGIGFGPQEAEKIFNTFARLHSKDQYEGTGLGLALCKKIVERHGGTITASGQPGAGATFVVTLPVKQEKGSI